MFAPGYDDFKLIGRIIEFARGSNGLDLRLIRSGGNQHSHSRKRIGHRNKLKFAIQSSRRKMSACARPLGDREREHLTTDPACGTGNAKIT